MEKKDLSWDLENWMRNLPPRLRNMSIIYLAIPGSHDSMTFSITRHSSVSPDAAAFIQSLKVFGPILRLIMSRWSKTQGLDVLRQLKSGIRYFDLRTSTKAGSNAFYFVHGLYAGDAVVELTKINCFLGEHPDELVILDFQHFFSMSQLNHKHFIRNILSIFGDKMLPFTPYMDHLSLNVLTQTNKYQVIVIYRSNVFGFDQSKLWPAICFPTPWPNTLNPDLLIEKLNSGLAGRSPNCGYVSQCILTPTVWFVCKYLLGNLKSKCVIPLDKFKFTWINQQKPGPDGVNIIISDFVELQDYQFCREVINLNLKLSREDLATSTNSNSNTSYSSDSVSTDD